MNLGLHHLHVRKRISRGREPYPALSAPKRFLDLTMYVVSVFAPLALLPQISSIYIDKMTEGISVVTWSLLSVFNTLWVLYGIVHKERPIILAHSLFIILNLTIVFGVLYYGN